MAADPKVILFGGVGSATSSMAKCFPGFLVYSNDEAEGKLDEILREIDSHPGQKYIVAGHSSGAVHAERVGRKVRNPDQIKLVLLDGYGDEKVQDRVKDSSCWYAMRGNSGSLNSESMKKICKHPKKYEDDHCNTAWCLHFSLVNSNAPADLRQGTFRAQGYANCKANLRWVNE